MNHIEFTTRMDEHDRIAIPPEVARQIPLHSTVNVQLDIPEPKRLGRKTGALEYYMKHGIDMPGILPFDRDSLYRF